MDGHNYTVCVTASNCIGESEPTCTNFVTDDPTTSPKSNVECIIVSHCIILLTL